MLKQVFPLLIFEMFSANYVFRLIVFRQSDVSLSKNSVLPSKIQQSKQYTSDLSNFLIGEYLGKNKNRVAQIENIGV